MSGLIGNTPLIKINYKYKDRIKSVYVKLEYYNLTGSIKDRIVCYIINKAYNDGLLKADMPLVEATSGNTGISISAIGAYFKHPVYIFMPDWVSKERVAIMKLYGANVTLVSKEEGGFAKCISLAKEYALKNNGFLVDQFNNKNNILAHYEGTGKEIINKIIPTKFISGIGTGGTLMGIARRLKEVNPKCLVYALEPDTMSLIKEKHIGSHKIEGIGDDFIPSIVDTSILKDCLLIKDLDAINMSKKLATELGLGVGISSGANFLGAVLINDNDDTTVTVFPDDLKKYLSTDLTKNFSDNNLISNDIELLSYEIV